MQPHSVHLTSREDRQAQSVLLLRLAPRARRSTREIPPQAACRLVVENSGISASGHPHILPISPTNAIPSLARSASGVFGFVLREVEPDLH
jgi:hypothetical protein